MVVCDKCNGIFTPHLMVDEKTCPCCGKEVRVIPEEEFKGIPEF